MTGTSTATVTPNAHENYALFVNTTTANITLTISVSGGGVIGNKTFVVGKGAALEVSFLKAGNYCILTNSGLLPIL